MEKIVFEGQIIDGKNFLVTYGFCWKSLYDLLKKLEFVNGYKSRNIICDEWNFINVFQNNDRFGLHHIEINDALIEMFCKALETKRKEDFFIICPVEENQVYGIVYL